ncbi:hypothetical protein SMU85_09388 [Streptococcus mutans ST6]|nr:hypothetical protein SMU85_09388 [Streptococcus mutans ST6]
MGVKQSSGLFQPEHENKKTKLFDDENIAARYVHCHNFNLFTNLFRVLVEEVFDGCFQG